MAARRRGYPQVDPRAEGLMTRAVAVVPAALPIEEAARVARRRGARLVVSRTGGGWGGAFPAALAGALALGLGRVPMGAILWGAAAVSTGMPEVAVRRRLSPGMPFVVVVSGGVAVGAVLRDRQSADGLGLSAAAALARLGERPEGLLRAVGAVAGEMGAQVAAVGGVVRDLLLERSRGARADLDVAVEGDGSELARRLARVLGGQVREHAPFLTATVTLPDGVRVDVATARRERYARPGALPRVEAATLVEDLARRDFSVNALAIRLDGARWGEVVDPTGGLADLRRHRIRVLHPLSFVEDPTRILRAVRFAVRLGFALEGTTRRLLSRAAALAVYNALSGDRLRAELGLILAEEDPAVVLERLGRVGAFRLLDPSYRFPEQAGRLLRGVAAVAALPFGAETMEALAVLVLTAHLRPGVAEACATRLGLPVAARVAIARARAEAPELLARLARVREPDEAYRVLRSVPELVAAWGHVRARGPRVRRYIRAHLERWRRLRPILSGDDLRAMGLTPGPAFGRLLDSLLAAQVAGRVRDREAATAFVRSALGTPSTACERNPSEPVRRVAWRRSTCS